MGGRRSSRGSLFIIVDTRIIGTVRNLQWITNQQTSSIPPVHLLVILPFLHFVKYTRLREHNLPTATIVMSRYTKFMETNREDSTGVWMAMLNAKRNASFHCCMHNLSSLSLFIEQVFAILHSDITRNPSCLANSFAVSSHFPATKLVVYYHETEKSLSPWAVSGKHPREMDNRKL